MYMTRWWDYLHAMTGIAQPVEVLPPASASRQIYNNNTTVVIHKVQTAVGARIPRPGGEEKESPQRVLVVAVVEPLFLVLEHDHRVRPGRRRLQGHVVVDQLLEQDVRVEAAGVYLKVDSVSSCKVQEDLCRI